MSNIILKSTALAAGEAVTGSMKSLLDDGVLNIYAGPPPAHPNDALAGNTLLCQLTLGGDGVTGLVFDAAATNGVLKKPPAAVWSGTNAASGTGSFWRWNSNAGDDNSAVAGSNYRLQGTVGTDASESMFLSTTTFVAGATTALDTFQIIL